MAQGRTTVEILHPEDHINLDNLADRALSIRQLQTALNGLANGAIGHQDTTIYVAQGGVQATGSYALSGVGGTAATGSYALSGVGGTAATGSYALSGVGGTAASNTVTVSGVDGVAAANTVTLGGDAGDLTITVDGTEIGPVPFNTSDEVSAQDWVTEANLDGTFAAKATASSLGDVITITWDTKGAVGNSKTLTASRTAGTATVGGNGTTLGGGADNTVTVVTDGTSVPTNTTTLSNDAAATAIAAALQADGTFAAKATATAGTNVVTIVWDTKGTVGNSKTLTASSTAGTATVGGNGTTLGGGAQGAVTVAIAGTSIGPTDTTNLTDTAAATAVAAAIELNGTIGPQLVAAGVAADVTLTWSTKGTVGNAVTLGVGVSATGTATRSAATLTGGAQGAVTVEINGTSVGPVAVTNLSDTAAATAVAAAIELNGTLGPLLAAVGSTTNVNITWGVKGTVGNAITLAAGVSTTGTATRSAATLTGGAQGSVTITVAGTAEVTDTTTLTDAAAATLIATELNANATINDYVTAEGSGSSVLLTAIPYGVIGNTVALAAGVSTTGTATRSAATLTGGLEATGQFLERP